LTAQTNKIFTLEVKYALILLPIVTSINWTEKTEFTAISYTHCVALLFFAWEKWEKKSWKMFEIESESKVQGEGGN